MVRAGCANAAPILLDDVSARPYAAIDSVHTDPLDPMPAHEAATVLHSFPAEAAAALLARTGVGSGSPQVLVEVRQMGGAIARPGAHESAFPSRDAAYSLLVVGIGGIPAVEEDAAAIIDAMAPWVGGHRLPNFSFEAESLAEAYTEETLKRLREARRNLRPRWSHRHRGRAGRLSGRSAVRRQAGVVGVLIASAPTPRAVLAVGAGAAARSRSCPASCSAGGGRPNGDPDH